VKNIRFIQFPHPGGEHRPRPNGKCKLWNWLKNPSGTDNPHARTFFQANGRRLTDSATGPVAGPIWAWGEWEAEARVIRSLDCSGQKPATLFEPYWVPKISFENLHNTDPFVFGGFYYTDCKQGTAPSLKGMLEFDVGSVIIFGSGFNDAGEARWVLDTVFVVSDYVDHNISNYQDRLRDRVPPGYDQVVLGPTYEAHSPRRNLPRRLYIGATYDNPVNGMFSFFPCVAPGTDQGFARPEIRLSSTLTGKHFNPRLRQGMKGQGNGALTLGEIKMLWAEVCAQVRLNGCDLGIWADLPNRHG
jgi:hypothetical protein